MNQYLYLSSSICGCFDFDFAFSFGFQNTINQSGRIESKTEFGNDQRISGCVLARTRVPRPPQSVIVI
jgi:hypothetical protein